MLSAIAHKKALNGTVRAFYNLIPDLKLIIRFAAPCKMAGSR